MSPLIASLKKAKEEEKKLIVDHIQGLRRDILMQNRELEENLGKINLIKPLQQAMGTAQQQTKLKRSPASKQPRKSYANNFEITELEKLTLKRIKHGKEKLIVETEKKASSFAAFAAKTFSTQSRKLVNESIFRPLEKDLLKTNVEYTTVTYISMMLLVTIIAFCISIVLFLFLLVFSVDKFPIIELAKGPIIERLIKFIWILIIVPIGTFLFMYAYPSMERKSTESKINQELPFATIHMAAISGSMVEPSKIFNILISTKEYPYLEKEFTKLINFIHIYGYDLVAALRAIAKSTASKRLADLLNSLATTITSGGGLSNFFEKRSQNLLFDYRLERQKQIRAAETFMDIYISVVIAAPMIIMLLLMMMKVSGMGMTISGNMISLLMVLGVAMLNVVFLVFLHLKEPGNE
jgi:flagellar protein FlaJ